MVSEQQPTGTAGAPRPPAPSSVAKPAPVLPVFARLAKRRPDLTSAHFSLAWTTVTSGDLPPARAARPLLALAVAKRYLPRAVDRNAMKRVSREAWRARLRQVAGPSHALLRVRQAPPEWRALPDGQKKRLWRSEIDALLLRMRVDGPRARVESK